MCADNVKRLSEFELIEWIRQQAGGSWSLDLGIGDDCAINKIAPEYDLLTSTDLFIEGVHFKREWTTLYNLGRKAAAVNISDIAAMGGAPQALFLGIGRSSQITDQETQELISGFIFEAQRHGAVLAGGDTCGSSGPLIMAVTVQGQVAEGEAICRHGASYGDAIYVSGTLGDSSLALQQLQAGRSPESYLAQRFHLPTPRVGLGQILSAKQIATAMLDVSDGLLADLGHILSASQVGAELELDNLPLSESFRQELQKNSSLLDLALSGGEDYELVFTSPVKDLANQPNLPIPVTRIGLITQGHELRLRQSDGQLYQCQREGFDHFA